MDEKKYVITRRQALQLSGVAALAAFIAACSGNSGPSGANPGSPTVAALPGVGTGSAGGTALPPVNGQVAITPVADFYTVAFSDYAPQAPSDWALNVSGLVKTELTLSLDDLKKFENIDEMRTFECISNPVGGTLIGNANWKAVRFADVLDKAGVLPTTKTLKLESFDGYHTGVPLDTCLDAKSLLAFEMNGAPLVPEHGAPLRCIFPGRYGMKQPKWIQKITALDGDYTGYWEGQGWSNDAFVLPNSRIDVPQDGDAVKAEGLQIRGVAFDDGHDGIAKVEVSYDNGKTWKETTLVRGPNPFVWTNWSWQGDVPAGSAVLLAKVTTNSGKTQNKSTVSLLGGTFPDGTSDIQQVVVSVSS